MFCNAVYGIADSIAYIGMIPIWLALSLQLGQWNIVTNVDQDCSSNELEPSKKKKRKSVFEINRWNYWVFYAFFGIVYFYAGLAKTSLDWLTGYFTRDLLLHNAWNNANASRIFVHSLSSFLGISTDDFIEYFALGGLIFDLTVSVGLCFPFSMVRLFYTTVAVLFHLTNHHLFVIETFPWVMLSSCVLYHDAAWMDNVALLLTNLYNRLIPTGFVVKLKQRLQFVGALAAPTLCVGLLVVHALLPLLCGLHTILDPGNISWSSQCHFFNWRMMSRSANTVQCQFRLFSGPTDMSITYVRSPTALFHFFQMRNLSNLPTLVNLQSLGYDERKCGLEGRDCVDGRNFLMQTPQYEDRLWAVLRDIRNRVAVAERDMSIVANANLTILSDVWLEVNGPPVQRFVSPHIDISATQNFSFSTNFSPWESANYVSLWQFLASGGRQRPAVGPPVSWHFPRFDMFRSVEWQQRFRKLEVEELEAFSAELNSTCQAEEMDSCFISIAKKLEQFRVLFLADVASSGSSTLILGSPTRIRVLSGAALFHHDQLGLLLPGQEIMIQGSILWSPLQREPCIDLSDCSSVIEKEDPCLLMIILTEGTKTFSIS